MSKVRVVVAISTKKDISYEVGKTFNGYTIKQISFRRDGLTSVNHGLPTGGAHYLVVLEDPMNDKDKIFKVIPYDNIEDILFINAEKEDGNPSETAVELKRA